MVVTLCIKVHYENFPNANLQSWMSCLQIVYIWIKVFKMIFCVNLKHTSNHSVFIGGSTTSVHCPYIATSLINYWAIYSWLMVYIYIYTYLLYVYYHTCRSPMCNDILSCHGDQVRLAVRVKVYPYPEDVCAVWVMFAVKYRSIV